MRNGRLLAQSPPNDLIRAHGLTVMIMWLSCDFVFLDAGGSVPETLS